MKEEEEDSIDKLFNQGLSNPGDNESYREEDWERMEAMLDGKKPKGIIYRLSYIIAGAAAILLLAFGWLYLNNSIKPDKTKPQLVKTVPKIQKGPGTDGPPTQQLGDPKNTLSANGYTGNSADGVSRKSKSFFTLSAATGGRTDTGKDVIVIPLSTASTTIDSGKQQPANTLANNNTHTDTTKTIAVTPATALVSVTDDIKPKKKKPSASVQAYKPTLALSIIGSPDINSVQGFSQNKVGTNVGMMLSLGITKKWSISAGAVYADKPYVAPFSKYATAYQFSTNPSSVSASCIVLDIPVNVGYRFYNKNGNKFSLGTGLSSYFMLRENYTFNYDGPAGGPPSYNIKNQNKHLFGILNLNATYQREVNSKFDIGIQPYVKLPLTSIGYGQVNLKSAGVAVSVMWNINTGTKP
jgi:hypothetical protein